MIVISPDHTHIDTNKLGKTSLEKKPAGRRALYLHSTQSSREAKRQGCGGFKTRKPSKRAAANLHPKFNEFDT
jgi:hypothetical protein